MPPGVPFIVGNELAERFSFYGMRSILLAYMTLYLCQPGGGLAACGLWPVVRSTGHTAHPGHDQVCFHNLLKF